MSCFQLKANFFPCTVVQLTKYDLESLSEQLALTVSKAPNFFMGTPVLVDLEMIKNLGTLNFNRIKQIFLAHGMVPVGVRGGSPEQQSDAATAGIPSLTIGKTAAAETNKKDVPAKSYKAKIITQPIRSGMQIYAKECDLIVIAPVSPGAELLADGNIHVYGPLRGRALAGVQGDTDARIFARSLAAELISIAGYYLMKDDIQIEDASVQVYLEGEQVKIQAI